MVIPINSRIVGTCGLCGGPVTVPMLWHGINMPPKTCRDCGAIAKEDYGPVLPMTPKQKWQDPGQSPYDAPRKRSTTRTCPPKKKE